MNNTLVNNFTDNGKCSNCGQCCSNMLPMSQTEVKRIKEYIKKHNIKEQRHNALSGVDMTCPFRDETNKKCLIYKVRPQICRQFMCNQNIEDMERRKIRYHNLFGFVCMRNEFFGSKEDIDFIKQMLRGVINGKD